MYSSIYRVQSTTRRLPIRALFVFTLKLVKSYLSLPLRASVCGGLSLVSTLGHLINDVVASIKHKISADGNQHTHSNAMQKEHMDSILTWAGSICQLDFAFNCLRFKMTGLGLPLPTLDKDTKLVLTRQLEYLTFSAIAFTLWMRCVRSGVVSN